MLASFKYKFNLLMILLLSRVESRPPISNIQKPLSNSKLLLDKLEITVPKYVTKPCSKCFNFNRPKSCQKCIKKIRYAMSEKELSSNEVYYYETVKQNLREYFAMLYRTRL